MSDVSVRNARRFDRESIDTILLVIAFLGGISLSLGFKFLGFPAWAPALSSAAVIVLYAIFTYFSRGARLEPDQIGDNAYYLGFVLTLTSLSYTLWELGRDNTTDFLNSVIAGFGIALSSTIVGVIVRVLLLQYRVDLVARDKEARLQLNEAMRRFQVEIQDMVRGTRYLGAEIRQSLDEHHKEVADSYERRTEKLVDELVRTFKDALEQVLEQGKEVNRSLAQSSRRAMEEGEQAILETLASIGGNLQETSATLADGMNHANRALKERLDAASNAHAGTMDALRNEARSVIEETSRSHGEIVKHYSATLEASSRSIQDSATTFTRRLAEALKEIEVGVSAISTASVSSGQEIANATTRLTKALEETAIELKGQAEGLRALAEKSGTVADALGPSSVKQSVSAPPASIEQTRSRGALFGIFGSKD